MGVRIGVVVFPGSNCDRDTLHALDAGRRRAGRPVARGRDARGRRGGRPAGRVRLRRLPAGRGDRPVQPGHARGRCVRRGRRAGPRHLQRVPGAGRGRAGARRAAAQRVAPVRRPARSRSRPSGSTRRSPMRSTAGTPCACPSPTARAGTTRTRPRSTRSSATAASCSATSTRAGAPAGPDDPANPNGSLRAIAGVLNAAGNVAGLMPHPERAAEAILGSDDGMGIIRSLVDSAARAANGPVTVGAGAR